MKNFFLFDSVPSLFNEELFFKRGYNSEYEIVENDSFFEISIETPGFKKEELKIELTGKEIRIVGEKEGRFKKRKLDYLFSLPRNVNQKNIEAKLEDGILYIKLFKVFEEESKLKIEIK